MYVYMCVHVCMCIMCGTTLPTVQSAASGHSEKCWDGKAPRGPEHPLGAVYLHAPSLPMLQEQGPLPQGSGGRVWAHQAPPRGCTRTMEPAERIPI